MKSLFPFLYLIGLVAQSAFAQELPPVVAYPPSEYNSDNQNWSIAQDHNEVIYVANNKGLLEFNGEDWKLYNSPNESIIRSVYANEDRIYTGCFRDFGYWERNQYGKLSYTSLTDSIAGLIEPNEEFWTILKQDKWLVFQSLNNIYLYHLERDEVKKIHIEGEINKAMLVDDEVFVSQPSKGIYKIKNAGLELVSEHPIFQNNLVVALYKDKNGILVQTESEGIYHLSDDIRYWEKDPQGLLRNFDVYNSIQTKDGELILGTISQGVVMVSLEDGKIDYHITKEQSLSNNTVLNVYEDTKKNIWLGLDNGIDCINFNSPIRIYQDKSGQLGTVYTSIVHDNYLYLGTNQGLFRKHIESNKAEFQFIKGSAGQVWSLYEHFGRLLCGHNTGLYEVTENEFYQLTNLPTWVVREVPNQPNRLLLGNYTGISLLNFDGENFVFQHSIEGFDLSARFVEFVDGTTLLVSHEYQGVYEVSIDATYTKATSVEQLESVDKGLFGSLSKLDNTIYYAYEKGIFEYDDEKRIFQINNELSLPFKQHGYSSGRVIVNNEKNSLWTFSNQSIHQFSRNDLDGSLIRFDIPINRAKRNSMSGYESVFNLYNDSYLMGNAQGYFVLDVNKVKSQKIDFEISLNTITNWDITEERRRVSLYENPSFDNRNNNIRFNYNVTNYGYFLDTEYQYRLKGTFDEWSDWTTESNVSFYNLDFGDYTFEVRAKIGDATSSNTVTYKFTVLRPFYLSNLALILYVLLIIIFGVAVHSAYNRHYKKQKTKIQADNKKEMELRQLENQRELMRLKNDQLQSDIESKNRELAISTMSMIKKNEFLNSIKDELTKIKEAPTEIKRVLRIINKNLNNNDDWKFFEEAFNNADKDFLKKIKEKHPSLTPNDLKLCAYLRLNLSSKEIAPLFSISIKSVEVKRYRLRKKMDLSRDESLTSYILEI